MATSTQNHQIILLELRWWAHYWDMSDLKLQVQYMNECILAESSNSITLKIYKKLFLILLRGTCKLENVLPR
jgi:hypothetical protein